MRFMSTIGLALSGGGFRAALYHLGLIRYFRDSGALEHVQDIAAVSGGSIVAAHLVLNWDRYTGDDAAFDEAASEVIRFVQFDLRNHIVRRLPLTFPVRLAGRLIGSDVAELSPNAILERYYREFLYGDRRLFELPERPGLHILTTNVSDGTLAAFNRGGLHILRRELGSRIEDPFQHIPGTMCTIAKAVGASSAFPGFFPPMRVTAADLGVSEGQFPGESFTDGGVYDNLGTRAFTWLQRLHNANYDRIIVSDAGKPFHILGRNPIGFLAQSLRATDILWDRVWQLERENFGDQNGFFVAPITRVVDPAEDPNALHPVVQAQISSLRTDLDRFSDLEVSALVRHGYEVSRATHRHIADRSDIPIHEGPSWDPFAGGHALDDVVGGGTLPRQATARTGGTCPVARVANTIKAGSQRRVWGTLLSSRDWPSYIYVVLGLILFVLLPIHFWQVHRHAEILTVVINSIAQGDPDIRLVLDLVDGDPSRSWKPIAIKPATEPTPQSDFQGVEILSFSRIMDLRAADPRNQEQVRTRDRLMLRFDDTAEARRHVVFHTLLPTSDISFRQPPDQPPVEIRRVETAGAEPYLEVHLDLSGVPAGEPVTLELASLMKSSILAAGRLPVDLISPADLLTVWLLFPEDHPYRSYRLLRYPEQEPDAAQPMMPRYTIDHPYGTLIGWSLINPTKGMVYECRWTP
jgi:predicted acylesterase/phospholipase RssA